MSTFTYTGAQQTYVVPAGVTAVTMECYGSQGQGSGGGKGGYVKATYVVTPGETLYVYVGGQSNFNGGGNGSIGGVAYNGGDKSDVRRGGTANANIELAGAGGGAGPVAAAGGAGGTPGAAGGGTSPGGGGTATGGGGAGGGGGGGGSAWAGGAGNGPTSSAGGGAGHYGGGSGNGTVGGGGGGNSWADPSAIDVPVYIAGTRAGTGQVVITPYVPPAPTLTAPTSGSYLDAVSGNVTLGWTYSADFSATQTGWQARRKIGSGAYGYWNGTDWSSTTAVTNAGSVSSAVTSGWANGNTYSWSIATVDAYGTSAFANDQLVTTAPAPTVTVTAPTGTATLDPVAHIAWTPGITAVGAAEIAARAIVYNAAQYGAGGFVPGVGPSAWDSGMLYGAPVTQASSQLVNGTYRAYVQITQTGGQTSAWAFSAFTINVTPPSTPVLVATTDPVNGRTALALSGLTAGDTASVQSSDDGGVTWQPVRNATSVTLTGTSLTLYDYEAPNNATRSYRAIQYSVTYAAPSAWSVTSSASTALQYWLKDPLNPALNIGLPYVTGADDKRTPVVEQLTVKHAWGRQFAVVISDSVMSGREGSLTVRTLTDADYTALRTLLIEQRVLFLQWPQLTGGSGMYIRRTSNAPAPFVPGANAGSPFRETTFSYVEQAAP